MIIGVTGGIGSGKTYICHLLEIASIPVFYSDTEASRIIDTDPDVKKAIIELFGENAYIGVQSMDEKGKVKQETDTLDRKLVADKVFSNPALREKMNAIVHPAVIKAFEEWKQRQDSKTVIIESAILFESGYNKFVDKVLVVTAPTDVRIERVMKRDGLTKEQVKKRIESQMKETDKQKSADYIIANGPHDDVNRQIFSFLDSIKENLY
ncbi:MAG: dephospho-CoA kinase [Paludibacteraceae bacterium]|nr:dephospho-CoA kinase [Paludibacteraceae bacterium]